MTAAIHHRFIAIDEGRQQICLVDTDRPGEGWVLELRDLPLARDLQRLGPDRALVGYDRGFFELEISTGKVVTVRDGWKNVTAACRRPDGTTLVTGLNLEEQTGVTVLTLDADLKVINKARRDGDYVRLMRPTEQGTYLLCTNDHILETKPDLTAIRELRAPGFYHAWKPHRFADGSTLVSGGYGSFLAQFDSQGNLVKTFGGVGDVPADVDPNFYATFQVLDDGRLVVANWQGHGPDNGHRGRQLVEFASDGTYLGSWSDPKRISSLQGILVL